MEAVRGTSQDAWLQGHSCKNLNMHTSMYVHTQFWSGSSYILSRYLWKHDLKPLNYESGQMLCLLTPHYTHSPLSHFFERGTENASRSFSQEWLTFRKTERKKQMGKRGVRQRETSYILTNESSV